MAKPSQSAMLPNCLRDAARNPSKWDVPGLLNDAADRIESLEALRQPTDEGVEETTAGLPAIKDGEAQAT